MGSARTPPTFSGHKGRVATARFSESGRYSRLGKGLHSNILVFFDVEDPLQVSDPQRLENRRARVQQFEITTLPLQAGVVPNQISHSRAVDVLHIVEVEQDLSLTLLDQLAN